MAEEDAAEGEDDEGDEERELNAGEERAERMEPGGCNVLRRETVTLRRPTDDWSVDDWLSCGDTETAHMSVPHPVKRRHV